jgi:hypothetical protein
MDWLPGTSEAANLCPCNDDSLGQTMTRKQTL